MWREHQLLKGYFFFILLESKCEFFRCNKKEREGVAIMFAAIPCGPLSSKYPFIQ